MKLHIFLWLGLAGLFSCNTTGTTETEGAATGAGALHSNPNFSPISRIWET
ncbi:MAG: hypothetical protein IPJ40_07835 [Saprospirales bacterium]|nr:hypothetical protein [Saprospirales bacterium]